FLAYVFHTASLSIPVLFRVPLHQNIPASPTRRSSALLLARLGDYRGRYGRGRGGHDHSDRDRDRSDDVRRRRARPLRRFTPHREYRKSTRLNSSHVKISYVVLCLKKKRLKQLFGHNTT